MAGVSRRTMALGLASLLAAPPARPARAASREPALTIWGPPAGPSITVIHAIATGALRPVAGDIAFRTWRNPDELRAGLTSKTMTLMVLPTQVAANLFNRGMGVRLVNVMTNGLLYIVSADSTIAGIRDLKGRSIAVPFRNDMPDLLLQRLLAGNGLSVKADLTLQFTGSPIEAIQLLLAGRVDAALVAEPAASAAIAKGQLGGKAISRVVDIQKAWGEMTGLPAVLPQAGLGVAAALLEREPAAVAAIHDALAGAAVSVNADPARAAGEAAAILQMPPPILQQSIPRSNLVAIRASEARPSLEAMLRVLAEADPGVVGGRLPTPDFYL